MQSSAIQAEPTETSAANTFGKDLKAKHLFLVRNGLKDETRDCCNSGDLAYILGFGVMLSTMEDSQRSSTSSKILHILDIQSYRDKIKSSVGLGIVIIIRDWGVEKKK